MKKKKTKQDPWFEPWESKKQKEKKHKKGGKKGNQTTKKNQTSLNFQELFGSFGLGC